MTGGVVVWITLVARGHHRFDEDLGYRMEQAASLTGIAPVRPCMLPLPLPYAAPSQRDPNPELVRTNGCSGIPDGSAH
ncbi:hypothetical protein D3C71_1105560 [compost metagenome]